MALGDVVIGLLTIGFGLASVKRGARMLAGTSSGGLARAPQPTRVPRGVRAATQTVAGPMNLQLKNVRTLKERVAHIQRLARKGKTDPKIYAWTRKVLTKKCGKDWCTAEKDTKAEIKALYEAHRAHVRYTSDPRGVDTYVNPRHTLAMQAADCDDFSALACASLESVGIKCKLKVIRTKDSPEPNHIYALAGVDKRRPSKFVGFDTSIAKYAGWEPPAHMIAESWIYDV
jgi:transglutaminase-like putative cysteine protease